MMSAQEDFEPMNHLTQALTLGITITLGAMLAAAHAGCSATPSGNSGGAGGAGGEEWTTSSSSGQGGEIFIPPDSGPACQNLECQIPTCNAGAATKITGIVHAPTPSQYGPADPLYNAVVYIPNAPLDPFKDGVTCDKCGTALSGKPVAVATTNAKGEFELVDVPAGMNIPFVVQIGKWRREVVIPEVAPCQTTALPDELTRLPRNQQEGSIPKIAIASSLYDAEECILRKIGVEDSEFTAGGGTGRIHIYRGNGATVPGALPMADLWSSVDVLKQYDMVLFPCSSVASNNQAAMKNVHDYADAGGRVFATDLSYPWYTQGPADFQGTANWVSWGSIGVNPLPAKIDQTFPKGQALAQWLYNIGATPSLGDINLNETYRVVDSVIAPTTQWLYSTSPMTVQTLSFNTPIGLPAEQQCGRAVYSNFHVAVGSATGTFPQECTPAPLTAQEKVLEFMLFDLASCVQDDTLDPIPPPK